MFGPLFALGTGMKRLFCISLLLSFASSLQAGDLPRLTLDEALELALRNNPTMRAAHYDRIRSEEERRAAVGLRMPQISINGAALRLGSDIGYDFNSLKAPLNEVAGSIGALLPEGGNSLIGMLTQPLQQADWQLTIQRKEMALVGAEIEIPIWMGGRINAANRAARLGVTLTEERNRESRSALIRQTITCYLGLILANDVTQVCEAAVAGMELHLKEARLRLENGVIAPTELLYVEYKLAEAQRDLKDARLREKTLRAALNNAMGTPTNGELVTTLFIVDSLESTSYYQALAEKQNPRLQQIATQQQMAHEGLRAERAAFLPEIAAIGGGTFCNYQLSKLAPRWAVGIGLRWRLFDGLNREHRYAATRAAEQRLTELEHYACSEVSLRIEELCNELSGRAEAFRSFESSLRFAESYLQSRRIAFLEGAANSSSVVDAELELKQIRTKRMECAYKFDLLLAELYEAVGISDQYTTLLRKGRVVRLEPSISSK